MKDEKPTLESRVEDLELERAIRAERRQALMNGFFAGVFIVLILVRLSKLREEEA